jgi:hypothetical protein
MINKQNSIPILLINEYVGKYSVFPLMYMCVRVLIVAFFSFHMIIDLFIGSNATISSFTATTTTPTSSRKP